MANIGGVMKEEMGNYNKIGEKKSESLSDDLLNAPVLFGLRQQGHLQAVGRMLADGQNWDEIGTQIGWEPETAKRFWLMELKSI